MPKRASLPWGQIGNQRQARSMSWPPTAARTPDQQEQQSHEIRPEGEMSYPDSKAVNSEDLSKSALHVLSGEILVEHVHNVVAPRRHQMQANGKIPIVRKTCLVMSNYTKEAQEKTQNG